MGQECVVGLGVDILGSYEIGKIEKDLGDTPYFAEQIWSEQEIARCESDPASRIRRYADCFAAKEAVLKALDDRGLNWTEIILQEDDQGQPSIELTGGARARAEQLGATSLSFSLAHSKKNTIALCIAYGQRA